MATLKMNKNRQANKHKKRERASERGREAKRERESDKDRNTTETQGEREGERERARNRDRDRQHVWQWSASFQVTRVWESAFRAQILSQSYPRGSRYASNLVLGNQGLKNTCNCYCFPGSILPQYQGIWTLFDGNCYHRARCFRNI